MNVRSIESLIAAQSALIAALDARDVGAIESATVHLADAVVGLRKTGAWHATVAERAAVDHGLKQAAAARARVNYLANEARERSERLHGARSDGAPSVYAADGQLFGAKPRH